jgi:hypothetical protein
MNKNVNFEMIDLIERKRFENILLKKNLKFFFSFVYFLKIIKEKEIELIILK